jgi:hypothetical protein
MQQCFGLLRGSAFPSPRVTRWIPMTAITKSQLQAQLDEAMARIAELEAQAEAPAQPEETRLESNSLQQIVWLQKNTPSKEWSRGVTAGGKPFLRFGAQFSRLDKATGERRFGGWKNYVSIMARSPKRSKPPSVEPTAWPTSLLSSSPATAPASAPTSATPSGW